MFHSQTVTIASNTLHFPAFPQGETQSNAAKVRKSNQPTSSSKMSPIRQRILLMLHSNYMPKVFMQFLAQMARYSTWKTGLQRKNYAHIWENAIRRRRLKASRNTWRTYIRSERRKKKQIYKSDTRKWFGYYRDLCRKKPLKPCWKRQLSFRWKRLSEKIKKWT